ncbi:unnamed protein product [Nippostrongylus brasiliensis]|uniref:Transposase n=1 Tax=Nippostrongylus brasiliensis TaxID=27835 RepID=A0A0N4YLF1_NIPBR|nr:unnamed protein product [Nippostrongylus brasiliensis]
MTVGEGRSSSADMAILADHTMTIDEHLQSMPMPMTCWNDQQFRSQEELVTFMLHQNNDIELFARCMLS